MPLLEALRKAGWTVAVHNDYRLNDELHTFWLFTHPVGLWVKGEGRTDTEALENAATAARLALGSKIPRHWLDQARQHMQVILTSAGNLRTVAKRLHHADAILDDDALDRHVALLDYALQCAAEET